MPQTPQTKMMLYFLPALMMFLFLRFASGLNLYYTVQNIVSIPQQYLLAKRRRQQQSQPRPPDKKAKT
jgi:membrane protein insertase Oxa1/YidC/SpoIIIJ